MTTFVYECAGCSLPGRHLAGRCFACRATGLALHRFGDELAVALCDRERRARQRGLGDSCGLLAAMRDLLAGRRPGVRP